MKLRQKLAVVLASAMVVSAVPVVTMAASSNGMVREVLKVSENTSFYESTTAAGLAIKFNDAWQGREEVFYIKLENAKWNQDRMDAWLNSSESAATVLRELGTTLTVINNKTELKVVIPARTSDEDIAKLDDQIMRIPFLVDGKTGDMTAELYKFGSQATITNGKWTFATTSDKKATVSVKDVPAFYNGGEIADIVLTETFTGSLEPGATIQIELQDAEWEFVGNDITVEYGYGYAGKTTQTVSVAIDPEETVAKDKDYGLLSVTIPATGVEADSIGTVTLKGIKVKSTTKTPEEGKLVVDIIGDDITGTKTNIEVAEVVKYSTYIEMKDEKAVEIEAGHSERVEFTIGERVDDSLVGSREIEVSLDKAHFDVRETAKDSTYPYYVNGVKGKLYIKANGEFADMAAVYADGFLDSTKYGVDDSIKLVSGLRFEIDSKGELIEDTLYVTLESGAQVNKEVDSFTVNAEVCVPVTEKDSKEVTIKATGRALENEISTTAVTIINPFNVETEEMRVKVGLQNQVGGKITLTETDKEMFNKGEITLSIGEDAPAGIRFESVGELEVTGDLKKADLSQDVEGGNKATIEIKRQSKAASTLTISDIKVTVDRTVPEGSYDLVIAGSSIDGDGHEIVIKDFFVVGTPNTEDIAANGLRRGTTTFVIGESKYTANGISYDMSAASYIQDPGYTMIPVRYVAEAFGVAQKDILFSNGTATFFAGERTIQLTNGSDIAIVNGAQIKMSTKVVIKDERTYAPVGEIARILGISGTWDNTTKTATFVNK